MRSADRGHPTGIGWCPPTRVTAFIHTRAKVGFVRARAFRRFIQKQRCRRVRFQTAPRLIPRREPVNAPLHNQTVRFQQRLGNRAAIDGDKGRDGLF